MVNWAHLINQATTTGKWALTPNSFFKNKSGETQYFRYLGILVPPRFLADLGIYQAILTFLFYYVELTLEY